MIQPDFLQDPPRLGNQYDDDPVLAAYLRRVFGSDLPQVEPDLRRFGGRVAGDVLALAEQANRHEPTLTQFDPWGRRIDRIDVSDAWNRLKGVSAEEGLIALGYERPVGWRSRVLQFVKLYLYAPSSAIQSCPLAMTDGAARLLEGRSEPELRSAFEHLTSRDPDTFWTSGQWMTERTGGSDVGGTSTVADLRPGDPDGWHRLSGFKWFTSAIGAEMAVTLARIRDADGGMQAGSRGLSTFFVPVRDPDGSLNGLKVARLKDKLGTRALPTCELELDGSRALLISDPGRGVATIVTLVNVTRLHNAINAVAMLRRGLQLARDYAHRRVAFGKSLAQHPLHVETLAALEVECRAGFLLSFHALELLGKDDVGEASAEESAMLRLLTPLAKLYTGKQVVAGISEILESFGGAGYVEDTGLPRMLRDAQVLPIWEGTTNVLSLDALRAIRRDDALGPLLEATGRRARAAVAAGLPEAAAIVDALAGWPAALKAAEEAGPEATEAGARGFAFVLTQVVAASLLAEHAAATGSAVDREALRRWLRKPLVPSPGPDTATRDLSAALALG